MLGFLAEVTPTVTLPANWYDSIVSVAASNAPALITGFLAVFAIGFGLYWLTAKIKSSSKKAA